MSKQIFKSLFNLNSVIIKMPKTYPILVNKFNFSAATSVPGILEEQNKSKFSSSDKAPESSYRCYANNPVKFENIEHDEKHLGKFYRIKTEDLNTIDPFKDHLSQDHYEEFKTFNENCLMIRKPAVEIISYLKRLDLTKPAYRFVLYGLENGTGKRSTLLHLLHYAYKDNWLLIHLPRCGSVLRQAKESQPSTYKEGRLDTPVDADRFLKRFAFQNMEMLKKINLTTTKTYKWSNKDSHPEGTPILELLEYAKTKLSYTSDICGAIIREIKAQSQIKKFKVFVGIDQMNSYFGPTRHRRLIDKSEITVDDITIARNFKKLLKNDWSNGVVVSIISNAGVTIPSPSSRKRNYISTINIADRKRVRCKLHYEGPLTPAHLLKDNGFKYLEPFVPVEVSSYSREEIKNHFEYYKNRNWIQNNEAVTEEGLEELIFLSGYNPEQFKRVIKPL